MILVENFNERIENIFSREGLAIRCIFLSPSEDSPVELIFPIGREAELFRIASKHGSHLEYYISSTKRLLPRTVLFHFAYEIFGSISLPTGYFVSSNLTNLKDPTLSTINVLEVKSPMSTENWKAQVLGYSVDLVLVGPPNPEIIQKVSAEALMNATNLNAQSRFLKISKLRLAQAPNRFTSRSALEFWDLA